MANKEAFKYIAINYGKPGPVVFSQLIEYTLRMACHDIYFDYYFLVPGNMYLTSKNKFVSNINNLKRKIKGSVTVFPAPFINYSSALKLYGFYIKQRACHDRRYTKTIIHPRGLPSALIANYIRRRDASVSYLYDMRGDSLAELEYQSRLLPQEITHITSSYKSMESQAVHGAGHVICVSSVLKDIAMKRYGLDWEKVTVIPCCADDELFKPDLSKRTEARSRLNLDGTFNLIYCGGLDKWHCADDLFRLAGGVLRSVPETFFVVLTPQRKEAFELAARHLPENRFLINEVPREEVPSYMVAGDIAIILRQNTAVNRASSPTKIAEYLISGLPVILTKNIGDYSELIANNGVGLLLDNDPLYVEKSIPSVVEYIKKRQWPEKEFISKFGIENFSKSKFTPQLMKIYDLISTP